MTIWNDFSNMASNAVTGAESLAVSAAHGVESLASSATSALSSEAQTLHDGAKTVAHNLAAASITIDKYETEGAHQLVLFGEGVVSGALLNPINGLEQVVNNVAGTHLPKLELPNQDEVNHSIAGKIGMVAGTIADFVLTDGAVSAIGGIEAGGALSLGITGAIQGGLLNPSDSTKTGAAFFVDRLENAAIDGASYAVMGGIAGKLGGLYDPGASLATRMATSAGINGVGGGAGGLVTAEGTALLKEGRLANQDELTSSVGSGLAFGAGFGAGMVGLEAAVQAARGPVRPGDDLLPRLNRGYDNPEQVAGQIKVSGEVSQGFINRVAGTLDDLPDGARQFMDDTGLRVKVAGRVGDIAPNLVGDSPRGWSSGTWNNAEGFYDSHGNAVVTEFKEDNGALVQSDRVPGAVRHEVGHGIDDMLSNFGTNFQKFSQTPEFEAAWKADISGMDAATRAQLAYYIQESTPGAGQSEAFADLFAALNGGSANQSQTGLILKNFPRAAQAIIQRLGQIRP